MKIVFYTMDLSLKDSLEARRAVSFFEFLVTDPSRGVPLGAAVLIVPDGWRGNNSWILSGYYDFHKAGFIKI
jgi:hypothetical protein